MMEKFLKTLKKKRAALAPLLAGLIKDGGSLDGGYRKSLIGDIVGG